MLPPVPFRPPSTGNPATTVSTTANTVIHVSSGLAGCAGRLLGICCTSDFNFVAYDASGAPSDPTNNSAFPAGVYLFEWNEKNIGFKLNPTTSSKVLTYWVASRE